MHTKDKGKKHPAGSGLRKLNPQRGRSAQEVLHVVDGLGVGGYLFRLYLGMGRSERTVKYLSEEAGYQLLLKLGIQIHKKDTELIECDVLWEANE